MTFSLKDIALVMEKEGMGLSSTKYVLEGLRKSQTPPQTKKLTLKEALLDPEAKAIATNPNSRLRFRVITLYNYFLSQGIECSFSSADLEELIQVS